MQSHLQTKQVHVHRFQESEEEVWQSELDPLAEALVGGVWTNPLRYFMGEGDIDGEDVPDENGMPHPAHQMSQLCLASDDHEIPQLTVLEQDSLVLPTMSHHCDFPSLHGR